FTAAEVGFLLNDSGAKLLIIQDEFWDSIKPALPAAMQVLIVGTHPDCDHDAAAPKSYSDWRDRFAESETYSSAPRGHMAYTSGTTGKPKGVVRHVFPPGIAEERRQAARQLLHQTFGLAPGCRAMLPA